MPLLPHAWSAMKAGRLTIEVEFHESFNAHGMSRKQITTLCEDAVERGVVRAITGRPPVDAPLAQKAAEGDDIVAAA
jgi:hypothetical protein